jgi:alkylation response protein AidB-like acyl-CoA dehydrogenase
MMRVYGATRGGMWLVEDAPPGSITTRERLNEEQRMIGGTAGEFVDHDVLPVLEQLEQKDWGKARDLIKRCADLGLLATDVPEIYGGLALDKVSSVVVGEAVGRCASFATTFGAQTGLAITPLLCFGTEEQKQKYLPGLMSGELLGAYALSESGSGSDALGARTRATRTPDGSFSLSGEKMWITNGGFADVFIVFAKVDGEHFTAFIVERDFPGVSSGKEEHKLGLLGSSTTPLILQDAQVPAANLLGEIGKGHKIAFNTLNYGRLKLGAMCSGGGRPTIDEAVRYAIQRKQFGRSIASFGAIQQKIARMVSRQYAVEAMLYRTAGLIDATLGGSHEPGPILAALEEFAIEASILKVAASESIDFIVDENVQIHGGNGFVRDYPAERRYRDSRVNRIFEGTNEINRLLIPGLLVRRGIAGTPAAAAGDADQNLIASMKRAALTLLTTAVRTFGDKLTGEQEVLLASADAVIEVFASESALLRARQAAAPLHAATASLYIEAAAGRVEQAALAGLAGMLAGDALDKEAAEIRRMLTRRPINAIALGREVAEAAVERKGYAF